MILQARRSHLAVLTAVAAAIVVNGLSLGVFTSAASAQSSTGGELAPLAQSSGASADLDESAPAGAIVYRFYSPDNHSHFYTISVAERDAVILTYPSHTWTYEGPAYEAYTSQLPGTVPLYRFWSDTFRGHFYTTDEAEKTYVIDAYDDAIWHYEGVAYYVYPAGTDVDGTLDVARFWSPNNRHHFYTSSATEADYVRTHYAASEWTYEGIAFAVPGTTDTPAPLPTQPGTNPPPGPTQPANPGDSKNCSDFSTYAEAKAWFDTYYPFYGDVAKLDGDNDGIPCERLPGAP